MARKPTKRQQESVWRWAVRSRSFETITAMLASGWDVNHATKQGMTGLLDAAQLGLQDMFEFLLEQGAKPQHADEYLRLAIDCRHPGAMVAFLRTQSWHTRTGELNGLGRALMRGKDDTARSLVAPDILNRPYIDWRAECPTPEYCCVLAIAAQHCPTLLRALLSEGADPNFVPIARCKRTVFMHLCGVPKVSMRTMNALVSAGANPHQVDARGETALFVAARAGNTPLMGLLRKQGVDLSAHNHDGETAIDVAARGASPASNGYSPRDLLLQWAAEDQANALLRKTATASGHSPGNRL